MEADRSKGVAARDNAETIVRKKSREHFQTEDSRPIPHPVQQLLQHS
jgi:hypothetical protein